MSLFGLVLSSLIAIHGAHVKQAAPGAARSAPPVNVVWKVMQAPLGGLMPLDMRQVLAERKDHWDIWSPDLWGLPKNLETPATEIDSGILSDSLRMFSTTMQPAFQPTDVRRYFHLLKSHPSANINTAAVVYEAKGTDLAWINLGGDFGLLYKPRRDSRLGDAGAVNAEVLATCWTLFNITNTNPMPEVRVKGAAGHRGIWTGSIIFNPNLYSNSPGQVRHWDDVFNFLTDGRCIYFQFFGDDKLMKVDPSGGAAAAKTTGG
jgi:hypothetical protein